MDIDENGWLGHCLQCGYMGKAANRSPGPSSSETASSLSADIGTRLARPMYFAKK